MTTYIIIKHDQEGLKSTTDLNTAIDLFTEHFPSIKEYLEAILWLEFGYDSRATFTLQCFGKRIQMFGFDPNEGEI